MTLHIITKKTPLKQKTPPTNKHTNPKKPETQQKTHQLITIFVYSSKALLSFAEEITLSPRRTAFYSVFYMYFFQKIYLVTFSTI